MGRVGFASLVIGFLLLGAVSAAACSCERPPPGVRSYAQHKAWLFDRASNVVGGRIIEVYSDPETIRVFEHVLVAKMNVTSILKCDVPLGEVTVTTRSDSPGCGNPGFLISGVAQSRYKDVFVELTKRRESMEYKIALCEFYSLMPVSMPPRATP